MKLGGNKFCLHDRTPVRNWLTESPRHVIKKLSAYTYMRGPLLSIVGVRNRRLTGTVTRHNHHQQFNWRDIKMKDILFIWEIILITLHVWLYRASDRVVGHSWTIKVMVVLSGPISKCQSCYSITSLSKWWVQSRIWHLQWMSNLLLWAWLNEINLRNSNRINLGQGTKTRDDFFNFAFELQFSVETCGWSETEMAESLGGSSISIVFVQAWLLIMLSSDN